jgi:hypothetical protein
VERHVIDGDEVAEAARQVADVDDGGIHGPGKQESGVRSQESGVRS